MRDTVYQHNYITAVLYNDAVSVKCWPGNISIFLIRHIIPIVLVFSLLVRNGMDVKDTPTTPSRKETLAMIHKLDLGYSRVLCHPRLCNSLLAFSGWLCSMFQVHTPLVELIPFQ